MLPINLDDLGPTHIQELIDSEVAEGLSLEYKQALPGGQSDQKREFLYDIAALANTGGGDVVYGVVDRRSGNDQSTGIAEKLSGIVLTNPQSDIDRLTNLIRDGIAPRIMGIGMRVLNCSGGDVLVIRVPSSWNPPHMVTIGGANKFFGRTAMGKYPMSVDEIGRVFSQQRELGEIIRKWRSERVNALVYGQGPVELDGEVTTLLHIIPASAFSHHVLRDSWKVSERDKAIHVPKGITTYRYNGDGFLGLAQVGDKVYGYTQVFRSGIIEYADGHCSGAVGGLEGNKWIYGQEIEKQVALCYKDAVMRLRVQGMVEPIYLGLSLTGTAGERFFVTHSHSVFPPPACRQNTFLSPEVFSDINELEDFPYPKALLPLVDTMWQLAGREGSPFKPRGIWDPFKDYR